MAAVVMIFGVTLVSILASYFVLQMLVLQFMVGVIANSILAGITLYTTRFVTYKPMLKRGISLVTVAVFIASATFFFLPIFFGDSDFFIISRLELLGMGTVLSSTRLIVS